MYKALIRCDQSALDALSVTCGHQSISVYVAVIFALIGTPPSTVHATRFTIITVLSSLKHDAKRLFKISHLPFPHSGFSAALTRICNTMDNFD